MLTVQYGRFGAAMDLYREIVVLERVLAVAACYFPNRSDEELGGWPAPEGNGARLLFVYTLRFSGRLRVCCPPRSFVKKA